MQPTRRARHADIVNVLDEIYSALSELSDLPKSDDPTLVVFWWVFFPRLRTYFLEFFPGSSGIQPTRRVRYADIVNVLDEIDSDL